MALSRLIRFVAGLAIGGILGYIGVFLVIMGIAAVTLPIFYLIGEHTLSGASQWLVIWGVYGIYGSLAIYFFSICIPLDFLSGVFVSLPIYSLVVMKEFIQN
jgi:hypothetical protein